MQRVVSVWLPQFPIERLRRALWLGRRPKAKNAGDEPRDRGAALPAPFALVEGGGRGVRIVAVNDAARQAGIAPGQSLADARASLPSLRTHPAERARDRAALEGLVRWAGRYGPLRNCEGCDGLWIDITGVAHLFGGEAALLADLHRQLVAAGFTARLGLADTAAAAWALARFGRSEMPGAIAPVGEAKIMLAGLPVEALRLTSVTVLLLRRLGLYNIGELYPLPRASLTRRFRDLRAVARGHAVDELADGVVLRLDQALGVIREPRKPFAPPSSRLVRQVFAEPLISPAGIDAAMAAAVEQLCLLLAQAGEGVRRLCLSLYRTDGSSAEITVGTSSPSRDGGHLGRLFAEKLGAVDLGFGVDVVTLDGVVVEPLDASQAALGAKPHAQGAQGLAQLVDRLSNRVGAAAVHRIAARQSHIPEQADITLPALGDHAAVAVSPDEVLAPRPPFLLGRPEPVEVIAEVPEGPPRRFRWRRAPHRVIKAEGPERIEPAWWQEIGAAPATKPAGPRDYYRVEDDRGGRYWVFREGHYGREANEGAPRWFVHGLFG